MKFNGSPMFRLHYKLKVVKQVSKKMNDEAYGGFAHKVKCAKLKLVAIQKCLL